MNALRASDIWTQISSLSRLLDTEAMKNMFHHLSVKNLKSGFKALDGTKARGIDKVSKKDYEKNLDSNIEKLLIRLHNGSYVPQPKREILIPKANGKMRPIAIACLEDKIVEKVAAEILTSIYEPVFVNSSYGFRPTRSCHHAVNRSEEILSGKNAFNFVVEIDLANFFNTVNHRILMRLLSKKINNKKFLSLIHRMLTGKIESENGDTVIPYVGTPQGGVVSPILANIFLHYAIDEWFVENYGNLARMVRYADDGIFFFKTQIEAEKFLLELKKRLLKFKLELNEDKTKVVDMSKDSNEVFDFLGFTFYRGRKRKSRGRLVHVKTSRAKLNKAIDEFTSWIKINRNRLKTKDILKKVNAKLRGHYNYFGYWCNRNNLHRFYNEVWKAAYTWLNKRGQMKSFTIEKFKNSVGKCLLQPPEIISLKQIGWNPYAR
jgi:RNA-directed DNA polymerase